jgi:hypothetical protein
VLLALSCGGSIGAATPALAGCYTSDAGCSGETLFYNYHYDGIGCSRVYWVDGGRTDFCLKPRESRSYAVKTGDAYCYRWDGLAMTDDCTRNWLYAKPRKAN